MNRIDKQVQQEVTRLLSWTIEKHNEFMYDCGLAYLVEIAPKYPQVVTQIAKSKSFWNWWFAHWELRDKEFIEITTSLGVHSSELVEAEYKGVHDPAELAKGQYLNGQVLEESYVNLIETITKEQVAA